MFKTAQQIYANKSQTILKKDHYITLGKTKNCTNETYMEPIKHYDPYYWLRDDSRTNQDILKILNDENKLNDEVMETTNELQKNIYEEIKSHIEETYDTWPRPHGKNEWNSDYKYFYRTIAGQTHDIYCRQKSNTNEVEVLLDVNILAKLIPTVDISNFSVTDDHKFMAYGVDYDGSENYELKIFDINSKKEFNHNIKVSLPYADFLWYIDYLTNEYYIYYCLSDEVRRMNQIWRYNCNTQENILIYKNDNQLNSCSISISNDYNYLIIEDNSSDTSSVYLLEHKTKDIKNVIPTILSHKYEIEPYQDKLIIMTNRDGYNNFKIMVSNIKDIGQDKWFDLVTYDQNKLLGIESVDVLKDFILISYISAGNKKIKVIHNPILDGSKQYDLLENTIEFNDICSYELYNLGFYNTHEIAISYTDLKTPRTILKYNLLNRSFQILRVKSVPNYNSSLYTTEYIYADNVPITLVYKTDIFNKDGSNPLFLTGYGAYGLTSDPSFDHQMIPLLNRGFIYAIAQIRGGGYLGRKWYEDGKLLNKKHTFEDFIKCTEYLIQEKYTNLNKISIYGGSAGGLLIGAVINMRPDLYKCAIADVPFVDAIVTMADETIPLTTPEWGNTNVLKYYEYIKTYSPVDNVKQNCSYPNVLIIAGLNDPRVQYWEPLKLLAKFRENDKKDTIKLIKTQMSNGHYGNSDRYESIRDTAFMYAFVLMTNEFENIKKNKNNKNKKLDKFIIFIISIILILIAFIIKNVF